MSIGSRGYRRQYEPPDRRRWILAAGAVVVAAAVGIGGAFAFGFIGSSQQIQRTATTDNMNCTLIVPANPLSAQGLATPYQLTATNPANGPCNEANAAQSAFVQGAVLDPATGQISVYNPLVIDQGTTAAAAPVVPALPANAVVGLWFGFNGNTLTLAGADQVGGTPPTTAAATATPPATAASTAAATAAPTATATAVPTAAAAVTPAAATSPTGAAAPSASASGPQQMVTPSVSAAASATASAPAAATVTTPAVTGTAPPANANSAAASGTPDAILQGANCVAGENIAGQGFSSFTQVAACNAVAFFQAANTAIQNGQLTVPALGTATDGQACLSTRNFGVIDQDQSDNVTTKYLALGNGTTAQDNAANAAALAGSTPIFNGSDNALIDAFVDPALGCTPWMVNDLANPGQTATALPLDELQSAAFDGNAAALVPLNDPMVLDNNANQNTDKANTYRSIVDQPALPAGQSPAEYCGDMESIQGVRLQQDVNLLIKGTSPMPAAASNLFTFLAMRLQQSFTNLNCQNFGLQNDVSTTVDGNGVVVAACFLQQVNAVTAGAGNPTFGMKVCPATTATAAATATATAAPTTTAAATATATAAPTATATAAPTATATTTTGTTTTRHRRHHHHRFF